MAAARGRKPKVSTQALKLTEALAFCSVASRENGESPYQAHVRLRDHFAVAFDGVIAAGHPIEEDLNCIPHTTRLQDAVLKCGKSLAISETDGGRLSIKGDNLRAVIPCLPFDGLPEVQPDPPIAVIDDRIKAAFAVVAGLASENAAHVVEASIFLQANSVIGTNRRLAMEAWHGIDLPPNLVLPKSFVAAVVKCAKPLAKFGFSDGSVTFYFEDGAWLKTQRYFDQWPDMGGIISQPSYPAAVIEGLFEAVEAVAAHNENDHVFFAADKVMSHPSEEVGAQYDLPGLQAGKVFDGELFKKLKNVAKAIDLTTYPDRAFFFGGEDAAPVRGVIMCVMDNRN